MDNSDLSARPISGVQLIRQTMSALQRMHKPSDDYAGAWECQYNDLENFGNCEIDLGERFGRWLLLGFARKGCGKEKELDRKAWLSLCPYRKMWGEDKLTADVGWKSDGYGYLPLDCAFLVVEADTGMLGLGSVRTGDVTEMLIAELLPVMIATNFQFVPGYGDGVGAIFIPQAATYLPASPALLAAAIQRMVSKIAERHLDT